MELEKTRPSLNRTRALLGVPGFPQEITRKQKEHITASEQGQASPGVRLSPAQSGGHRLHQEPEGSKHPSWEAPMSDHLTLRRGGETWGDVLRFLKIKGHVYFVITPKILTDSFVSPDSQVVLSFLQDSVCISFFFL